MANYDFENNLGKIARIYPDGNGLFIRFGGPGAKTAMHPTNGYYQLPITHPNYQAMVNLVYFSAQNGWTVAARTSANLESDGAAEIVYLVVDF
jgi:hypothetical protein